MNVIFRHMLIKNLQKLDKRIKVINYGGCGIAANALYESLSGLGVKCEIASVDDTCDPEMKVNYVIEQVVKGNLSDDKCPNGHLVIRFPDGFCLDTEGEFTKYSTYKEPVIPENMKKMLANHDLWNSRFIRCNRHLGGPRKELDKAVRKVVLKTFKKYHKIF